VHLGKPIITIGLLGLAIRLFFLWESSDDPSFLHPLVDAKTYHDLARLFPTTGWSEKFLWQSAFYPAFLTLVYKIAGVSVLTVKILQAVIGGVSCALTYHIGNTLYGRWVGLCAGLILVFYGPVVFFESRLLATSWAIFWTVALCSLLLHNLSRPTPRSLFIMGIALAGAVYTRPTFAVMFLFIATFFIPSQRLADITWRRRIGYASVFLLGFFMIAGPTSLFFKSSTGHLGIIPPSGGINLYIGNNPDHDATINIRPGLAWANLVAEPERHGYQPNPWSGDQYFRDLTFRYAKTQPIDFLSGLGKKALTLISSREIPRNLDIYLHREWSVLLSALVWQAGGWGFPFGLIFPFAMVGILYSNDKQSLVVKAMLVLLALSVILVFTSARYRAPLIPLFAVMAAAGLVIVGENLRRFQTRKFFGLAATVLLSVVLSIAPGPFAQEQSDLTAELYQGVGEGLYDNEEWEEAATHLKRSLEYDSSIHATHQMMGIAAANLKQFDLAVYHFEQATELRPDHQSTQANLQQARRERARALFLAGREIESTDPRQALKKYRAAAKDVPTWYKPVAREALVLATTADDSLRDGNAAVELARLAIAFRNAPDAYLMYVWAAALAELGRFDEASEIAREGLGILSDDQNDDIADQLKIELELFSNQQPVRN
jgi:4-amino-4-deoxy-L-arabinose transferase-like glycosyltransferase